MVEQSVCPSCGEALHPGVAFCTACGAAAGRSARQDPTKAPPIHPGMPPATPPPVPRQAAARQPGAGAGPPPPAEPPGHQPIQGFRGRDHRLHPGMVYQGFGIRLAAGILDSIIVLIAIFAFGAVLALVLGPELLDPGEDPAIGQEEPFSALTPIGWMPLQWAVFLIFPLGIAWLVSAFGGTPGKVICGVRIVDERTHRHLGFGRACGRAYAKSLLYSLVPCLGFILAIVAAVQMSQDPRRQAIHDRMAKSLCVRRSLPQGIAYGQSRGDVAAPVQPGPAGAPPAY